MATLLTVPASNFAVNNSQYNALEYGDIWYNPVQSIQKVPGLSFDAGPGAGDYFKSSNTDKTSTTINPNKTIYGSNPGDGFTLKRNADNREIFVNMKITMGNQSQETKHRQPNNQILRSWHMKQSRTMNSNANWKIHNLGFQLMNRKQRNQKVLWSAGWSNGDGNPNVGTEVIGLTGQDKWDSIRDLGDDWGVIAIYINIRSKATSGNLTSEGKFYGMKWGWHYRESVADKCRLVLPEPDNGYFYEINHVLGNPRRFGG